MKNFLISLLLLTGVNAFSQSYSNNVRVFNVKTFGAKGDGVTNDKTSIQAALNACAALGGGQVFFPNGVYLVTGLVTSVGGVNPNSILYIPQVLSSRDTNRTSIELIGETAPNFIPNTYDTTAAAAYQHTKRGSILYTTTTGSGDKPSVIGSIAAASAFQNFNYQNVMIKNITVLIKSNSTGGGPTVGGINMSSNMNFIGENIVVSIDSSAARNGRPTNNVAAIILPIKNTEEPVVLKNAMIVGFKYGVVISEHASLDNIAVAYCDFPFVQLKAGISSYYGKLLTEGCINSFYFPTRPILGLDSATTIGTAYFGVAQLMSALWVSSGYWYDYNKMVLDSSSYGVGDLPYLITKNGLGHTAYTDTFFTKYGGLLVSERRAERGVYSLGGNYLISAPPNQSFLGSRNAVSLRFMTNSLERGVIDSNGRFGIGVVSPTSFVHFKKDTAAAVVVSLDNATNGATAQNYFEVKNSSTNAVALGMKSGTYTPYGSLVPMEAFVASSNNSLNIAASGVLKFSAAVSGSPPLEAMRIDSVQRVLIGSTVDDGTGKLQVTGTTNLAATNVSGTFTNTGLGNFTNTGTTPLSVIGSNATRVTSYVQATNAASQATFYLENNRGSFASYGGFLYGGSTNATGNLFGVSRADALLIFADGASMLNFAMGTLTSKPFILGTNNTARATFLGTGTMRFAAGTATAGTAPIQFTSGTLNTVVVTGQEEYNNAFYQSNSALNRYAQGGVIADFTADVQNSGTSETDLLTYTTKASTLVATGEKLVFEASGTFNDLTATAQVQFYFGGTNIGNTGALTVSATGGWYAKIIVIRTGSTTARSVVSISTPGASTAQYTTETDITSLTFTNTNIIKITGTAGGASGGSSDITAKLGSIWWWGSANN